MFYLLQISIQFINLTHQLIYSFPVHFITNLPHFFQYLSTQILLHFYCELRGFRWHNRWNVLDKGCNYFIRNYLKAGKVLFNRHRFFLGFLDVSLNKCKSINQFWIIRWRFICIQLFDALCKFLNLLIFFRKLWI